MGIDTEDLIDMVLAEVKDELVKACAKFPPFRSAHEGVAIIEEEFLEFRAAAFWPHKEKEKFADETEARQLAAMAVRYIIDINCTMRSPR